MPGLALVGIAAGLIAAADWLLWPHWPGISLVLFFLVVDAAILAARGLRPMSGRLAAAGVVAVAGVLPLAEALSPWGLLSAVCATTVLALAARDRLPRHLVDLPATLARYAALSPFRLAADSLRWMVNGAASGAGGTLTLAALAWVVPLTLAAVFLLLFAAANPIIEAFLTGIKPDTLLPQLDALRIVFWGLVACFVWPLLRPGLLPWRRAPEVQGPSLPRAESLLFGRAAILRALLVFNAMFAVQTVLDVTYLWGGVRLPDGMSYAAYAHRGAYPLVVTALLAAAFVLAAMRKGGPAGQSPLIRRLVYVFVGQNVLLVVSSILRLDLYVGQYGLSELRAAAMIWMGLVVVGLVLIVLRIALHKSNKWLMATNLGALALTLYACAFVDFPALIARFNVEHSRLLVGGDGQELDLRYLQYLGPGVVPALDELLDRADPRRDAGAELDTARAIRNELAQAFLTRSGDWRGWSYRDARLTHYLLAKAGQIPYDREDATYLR